MTGPETTEGCCSEGVWRRKIPQHEKDGKTLFECTFGTCNPYIAATGLAATGVGYIAGLIPHPVAQACSKGAACVSAAAWVGSVMDTANFYLNCSELVCP